MKKMKMLTVYECPLCLNSLGIANPSQMPCKYINVINHLTIVHYRYLMSPMPL